MAKKAKAAKKPTGKSIRDRVIEQRKVRAEELLANPANWRKHPDQQRAAFRGLLKEIGFAGSALAYFSERAGGALTLIDGHLRREELGPRFELACTITDLTDAEADKLLAAYDPVGALAETDRATFDELLKRAAWDDADVNAMLAQVASEATVDEPVREVTEDDVPEPPAVPITKPGDLWLLGRHRLLCGDSTKAVDVARLMAGNRAMLMNTDPPYGVSYANDDRPNPGVAKPRVANDALEDDALQQFLEACFRAAVDDALTPNAAWYMWHAHLTQGYFAAAAAAAAANVVLHRQIIWVKPVLLLGRGQYHWKHEPCFMGWVKGNQPPDYGEGNGERTQTTIWEVGSVSQADRKEFNHATPKPVGLFAIPLIKHTKPGEVCYEPFSGSGPQFIAAEQLNRTCYGMEISPQYCDVVVTRWENLTGKKATLERRKASRRNARKAS